MRCKRHSTDLSSSVGVCASCLRERLFIVVEAQLKEENRKSSDPNPHHLTFPRSVSPYISCRKSDKDAEWSHQRRTLSDKRFYSTPQLGPNGTISAASVHKRRKYSFFKNLFRSKTQKFEPDRNSDPKAQELYCTDDATTSSSWFASAFTSKRKKKSRVITPSDPIAGRFVRRQCRGMSPANEFEDECDGESSGYTSESSQGWKETPRRAVAPVQRSGRRLNQARSVSGMAFCLSPLVRASPNRHWNQKGPPEFGISGDIRVPAKPHLGVASKFCANRSRKLANIGRLHRNY